MLRSSVIIIWARGDHPCEEIVYDYKLGTWRSSVLGIVLFYDSVLRSSAQTRGDHPCRYMDLLSPSWVMNSQCIPEEYHVYKVKRVLGILRHIISWCHIALYPLTSFSLDDNVFYWWLKST